MIQRKEKVRTYKYVRDSRKSVIDAQTLELYSRNYQVGVLGERAWWAWSVGVLSGYARWACSVVKPINYID